MRYAFMLLLLSCGCQNEGPPSRPMITESRKGSHPAVIAFREYEDLARAGSWEKLWDRIDKKSQDEMGKDFYIKVMKGLRDTGLMKPAQSIKVASLERDQVILDVVTWDGSKQKFTMVFENKAWKVHID